jgi:hypothetical protein
MPTGPSLRSKIAAALLKEDQLRVCKLSDADIRFMADAVIEALDDDFVDFGLWLAQEITGRSMTRIDLESCLADWKAGSDE